MKSQFRAKLFVNPIAGGGKCGRIYPAVVHTLREAGVECDVIISQYPGYIRQVSSELAGRGVETVIACGGDGTVNELVNGIAGTTTAMGVIPVGTANDFAVNMGMSREVSVSCAIIRERRTRRIDLVRVNDDKFFASTGCLGFDAEVAAFASRTRKARSNAFLLHVFGAILKFFSYRPKTVELSFDGKKYSGKVMLVAFGNIRSYARGMLITPGAVPDDSWLDICLVRPMPRWKTLTVLPAVYKGTHINNKEVSVYRTRSVHVLSSEPMALYADGDFMTTTPFRLEVMPKHLKVIVGLN